MNPLSMAVIGATFLLAAALIWSLLADRRRQGMQQRLKTVVAANRSEEEPLPSLTLRRRMSRAGPGNWHRLPQLAWARLQSEFAAAGNRIGVPHLVAVAFVAWCLTAALLVYFGGLDPALAFGLAGVAALAAAAALVRIAQARYQTKFLDVFPDGLDLICRALRAGLPVTDAMNLAAREVADPVGSELRQAMSEMQIGVEPQEALQRMADRTRVPDFRFYVVALALQRKTGGSLAETLTNLSAVIRARKMLRLKAKALSSEAKASAVILGILPFGVGGFLYLTNPAVMSVLFTDSRGRFMLGVACTTLVSGMLMMNSIIRRSLR